MLCASGTFLCAGGEFKKQAKDSQLFLTGCKAYVSDAPWDLGPTVRWEFLFMYSGLDCSAILFRPGNRGRRGPCPPGMGPPIRLRLSSVFYNGTDETFIRRRARAPLRNAEDRAPGSL